MAMISKEEMISRLNSGKNRPGNFCLTKFKTGKDGVETFRRPQGKGYSYFLFDNGVWKDVPKKEDE